MLLRHPKRNETSPNVTKRHETPHRQYTATDGRWRSIARVKELLRDYLKSFSSICVSIYLLVCVLGLTASLITSEDVHICGNTIIFLNMRLRIKLGPLNLLGMCTAYSRLTEPDWRMTAPQLQAKSKRLESTSINRS